MYEHLPQGGPDLNGRPDPVRASPPSPGSATDTWEFDVIGGQAVSIKADTVDAGTAADLIFQGSCAPSGDLITGDDDFDCTFPPPMFRCPLDAFFPTASATCTLNVVNTSFCTDPNTANYELTVTGAAALKLTGDDQP